MAPEILSRQASPVDGLLSSLKSVNLVFFFGFLISVADVNPNLDLLEGRNLPRYTSSGSDFNLDPNCPPDFIS